MSKLARAGASAAREDGWTPIDADLPEPEDVVLWLTSNIRECVVPASMNMYAADMEGFKVHAWQQNWRAWRPLPPIPNMEECPPYIYDGTDPEVNPPGVTTG